MQIYQYAERPRESLHFSNSRKIGMLLHPYRHIFSIHRYGMRLDDGSFLYLKDFLQLKQDTSHFPLETSQQIITMTAANPNAISIFVFEKDSDFSAINLLQITDNNGRNIKLQIPHTAVFLKKNQQKIQNFLKVKKVK